MASALRAWGLRDADGGTTFEGSVPGADRLRFLGTVSRYAGLLVSLELREDPRSDA